MDTWRVAPHCHNIARKRATLQDGTREHARGRVDAGWPTPLTRTSISSMFGMCEDSTCFQVYGNCATSCTSFTFRGCVEAFMQHTSQS
mmetsp:Transcript_11720/g.28036  ORF Transcript_11720/g.28036 Transcript_11720/m.28036 type:complete len:88 (+) Transcript_11720:321-584(+)